MNERLLYLKGRTVKLFFACLDVNSHHCRLQETHFGFILACDNGDGFLANADDLTDQSAFQRDLVTDSQVVHHIVEFLLLLLRAAPVEEDESNENDEHKSCGH